MLIEWNENTPQRQGDDGWVWSITASVGGVSVSQTRQRSRTLGAMRSDVMEAVAAALGLDPATACEYSDSHSLGGCMAALRRMAQEVERLEAAEHNANLEAAVKAWREESSRGVVMPAAQEEPDTVEAVMREWDRRAGTASKAAPTYPGRFFFYDEEGDLVAGWQAHGLVCSSDGPWRSGTLNDLRRALGLEVKP